MKRASSSVPRELQALCLRLRVTHVVASLRLPQLDGLGVESFDVSRQIDQAGTGRSCAYIDSDEVVLDDSVSHDNFSGFWIRVESVGPVGGRDYVLNEGVWYLS